MKILRETLRAKDRSAHILSQYIPPKAQKGFVGLKAFNLETVKVVDTAGEPALAQLKIQFWKSAVQKMFRRDATPQDLREPVCSCLHDAVVKEGANLHKKYLLTMAQTQADRLAKRPLRTLENMEQYGEGVYSQMNYALADMLQSDTTTQYLAANPELEGLVTESLAHIGQANGIAALLRGASFYAQKHNYLNLPIKSLQGAGISEQQVLDAAEARALREVRGLEDVVFEVATRANDHILTAKSLMGQFASETGKALPYSLVLPAMSAVPVEMYLEHLQRVDFDLDAPVKGDWKLPWRTWRVYKRGTL